MHHTTGGGEKSNLDQSQKSSPFVTEALVQREKSQQSQGQGALTLDTCS